MITTPNGKTLMNEQEAIQWLLKNNAIPFQCTANYVAGAEIGLGTIVNPSPAQVRVGSLIFFADSKVSTVIAITSNSFICSDEYNDLVDDVVYVSNVAQNASGHLIVTLSNGDTIDAGLIKQIANFSINASQHLIATYNDGTTTDLGAIFSGNITIGGNLTATGTISGPLLLESMTGYSVSILNDTKWTPIYIGVSKTGNKLTIVVFGTYTRVGTDDTYLNLVDITVANDVGPKLYPYTVQGITNILNDQILAFNLDSDLSTLTECSVVTTKQDWNKIRVQTRNLGNLTGGSNYFFRYECTFLLSDNLAS